MKAFVRRWHLPPTAVHSRQWMSSHAHAVDKSVSARLSAPPRPDRGAATPELIRPSPADVVQQQQQQHEQPRQERILTILKELSKAKLASLVLTTTFCGYMMAIPAGTASSLSFFTLAAGAPEWPLATLGGLMVGTGLCVSSANTYNQWIESALDAQMARTQRRPLVRGAVSPLQAFSLATGNAVLGTGILLAATNPTTAALGLLNIVLYAGVYTPMKRTSLYNTWVGSVVGAIPPMMGWAAATGGELGAGGMLMGALLFCWQFPHFNALSWNLKADYAKAGYRMAAVIDPDMCVRTSLRYTLALFPLSYAFCHFDVTGHDFLFTSTLLNLSLLGGAWGFYRRPGTAAARKLFMRSLVHLPAFLALLALHRIWHEYDSEKAMIQ